MKQYFIDYQNELYITDTPADFLKGEYAITQDKNVLYKIDRFTGKLTEFKTFASEKDCNNFIMNYCMDAGYINFGSDNASVAEYYYKNRIYDIASDNMNENDIDLINTLKENLEKLKPYL